MNYPRLSDLDTSHPQVAAAVSAAKEWAQRKAAGEHGISLILAGPNGTGKTHIAQAIWWSMRYSPEGIEGYDVPQGRFFTAANLIVELGPYVEENGMMHQPSPDYFVGSSPIIVIDDIGAKISMPFIKGEMQVEEIQIRYFLLIEHCLRRTRIERTEMDTQVVPYPPSLIMTTNMDVGGGSDSEFAKHIGMRAWDRLQPLCPKGFIVSMNDVPSWRVKESGR